MLLQICYVDHFANNSFITVHNTTSEGDLSIVNGLECILSLVRCEIE